MIFLFSPEADSNKFQAISALIALVGLAVTAALAWLKDLTDVSRRTRKLDYVSKRAELWKKLLDLQSSLDERELVKKSLRAFAQSEVTAITNHFAQGYDISFERRHFDHVNRIRRWLLLYQPLSAWSWLLRAAFYLCGIFFCKTAIDFLQSGFTQSDWEWQGSLLAVVFCGCMMLRFMCLTNDERNYDWESMWKDFQNRSKEVMLRDIEESSASAISRRLHLALGLAGRVSGFSRRLTVATIAELIGDTSTRRIESAISGNKALPFSYLDKICGLLGVRREWLLDGDLQTFYQKVKYVFARDFLRAIGKVEVRDAGGDLYDEMILVLSTDDSASVAIFGHTQRKPYSLDQLLLGNLSDWDLVLVCAITARSGPVSKLVQNPGLRHGLIFESSDFRKLVDGYLHPGVLLEPSVTHSPWNEDIWDLDCKDVRREPYTAGYRKARSTFERELETSGIRSNADLAKHVEEELKL